MILPVGSRGSWPARRCALHSPPRSVRFRRPPPISRNFAVSSPCGPISCYSPSGDGDAAAKTPRTSRTRRGSGNQPLCPRAGRRDSVASWRPLRSWRLGGCISPNIAKGGGQNQDVLATLGCRPQKRGSARQRPPRRGPTRRRWPTQYRPPWVLRLRIGPSPALWALARPARIRADANPRPARRLEARGGVTENVSAARLSHRPRGAPQTG